MWPKIETETLPWSHDPNDNAFIPKSRRRRILPTYEAAIPARIADRDVTLPHRLLERLIETTSLVTRFDEAQAARDYNLPALMLRSESASSSQIERLTSSVRNVALAEVTDKAPSNARLIARNIFAMREALAQTGPITIDSICRIHDVLMEDTGELPGLRHEQVWIGGTAYSPHEAQFVPPHHSRVPEYLDDLAAFANSNVPTIAKAAILHAQFETIHPFTDGNGRTGRALLHRVLACDDVLMHATLPISAGLLHDVDNYVSALTAYRDGKIEPIVGCMAEAIELSVIVGAKMAREIDAIIGRWRTTNADKRTSASYRLPALLVEQPIVSVPYVANHLGITERAARSVISRACERDMLAPMGNVHRGVLYQAPDLIDVLERAASVQGIRRMVRQESAQKD